MSLEFSYYYPVTFCLRSVAIERGFYILVQLGKEILSNLNMPILVRLLHI